MKFNWSGPGPDSSDRPGSGPSPNQSKLDFILEEWSRPKQLEKDPKQFENDLKLSEKLQMIDAC